MNTTPCRCAAVPLNGDQLGILDEIINRLRITPL